MPCSRESDLALSLSARTMVFAVVSKRPLAEKPPLAPGGAGWDLTGFWWPWESIAKEELLEMLTGAGRKEYCQKMASRRKSSRHSGPQCCSTGQGKRSIIILSGKRQKLLVFSFGVFFTFRENQGVFYYTNEGLSTIGRFRKAHQD